MRRRVSCPAVRTNADATDQFTRSGKATRRGSNLLSRRKNAPIATHSSFQTSKPSSVEYAFSCPSILTTGLGAESDTGAVDATRPAGDDARIPLPAADFFGICR